MDVCEQENNYECGPAAVRTILCSLGLDFSREQVLELVPSDPQEGTPPVLIKAGLDKLQIDYSESEHNTQSTLENAIDNAQLCLVAYQAWGSLREVNALESGHYSVVFGYTPTHFLLADPSIHPTVKRPHILGIRSIRKDIFLARWVDCDMHYTKFDHWMISVPLKQNLHTQ